MSRHVLIVGAGAAGIFAAISASRQGADVTLIEKTNRLGTKIRISGGGKCNITHHGLIPEILKGFPKNEAGFLRSSFYQFTNQHVLEQFSNYGLETYVRPDGRIFPLEGDARDVIDCLQRMLEDHKVDVRMEEAVGRLVADQGRLTKVISDRREYSPDFTIIATGGSSYPKTGTTGDAYKWLKDLGHTIITPRAALAPIDLVPSSSGIGVFGDHMGIAMRDVTLIARADQKEIDRWDGDMLVTHSGISGPTALGISRSVAATIIRTNVDLFVDLQPTKKFEQIQALLQRIKLSKPESRAQVLVEPFVAERLQPFLLNTAGIESGTKLQFVTVKQINILAEAIKRWKIGRVKSVPIEKGEVVAGGLSLDEVDPQTLLSKKVGALALAGELLDVAGAVGGYNLQAAFSTGWVAGESAAQLGRE